MKKWVVWILFVAGCFGLMVHGSDKYSKVKPIIKEMADTLEKFIVDLEKAENAGAVAEALDVYSKATVEIAPKVKKMMEKYPELKDETMRPKELKPLLDKMDELAKKLMGVYEKIGKYASDPKVKAATKRWEKAMALLDNGEEEEDE